jgi:hypothetical protein
MNSIHITLDELIADLPELAQAQLREAQDKLKRGEQGEHLMEPRRGASILRTRPALLELARAIYGFDHHAPQRDRTPECEPPKVVNGEPEWQTACPHLQRLWAAREAYELAALNAPEDSSGCHCHGSGLFTSRTTTGKHFACEGKGWQSPADVKRNNYYWNNVASIGA